MKSFLIFCVRLSDWTLQISYEVIPIVLVHSPFYNMRKVKASQASPAGDKMRDPGNAVAGHGPGGMENGKRWQI